MAADPPSIVISGPEALAEFRRGLDGPRVFELLAGAEGRLLVALAVGVGKSELLTKAIVYASSGHGGYDLIVALVPRRDILAELVARLPAGLEPVVLDPRPRGRCGDLDGRWAELEAAGCGLLAKRELCGRCPRRAGCPWPGQLGRRRLGGVRLILATQQHLAINPQFIDLLRLQTGARRVLVLLDESDLLVKGVRRTIRRADLDAFIAAQEAVLARAGGPTPAQAEWLDASRRVASAADAALRHGDWAFPPLDRDWAVAVQRAARDLVGPSFRFPGFELAAFAGSDPPSRERTAGGDVEFACPTDLGDEFIIFSGSIATGLARYRLDPGHDRPGLHSPFEGLRFEHPGTRWYNIRSIEGAACYFAKNMPRILDFFAAKIARNIRAGLRTLLIARKGFVGPCATGLATRLDRLGVGPVRVATGDWGAADLDNPRTLPLINYGISGVNRFGGHDAAYCLTGYYTNVHAVAEVVHDLCAAGPRAPVRLVVGGDPPRRRAVVDAPDGRAGILPRLAGWVLAQKEDDVVFQAVGRVRPLTKAREVITFQVGDVPGVRGVVDFRTVAEARAFFDIPTGRRSAVEARAGDARGLGDLGLSIPRIAAEMGVSVSSVKRYLRTGGGHEPLKRIKKKGS